MYIIRNTDVVSGRADLEELKNFDHFPTFMGCVDTDADEDVLATLSFNISKSTGMIQLNPVIDTKIVYQSGHDSGLTGASWHEHHHELAEFINKYQPSSIFEIGGGHGVLNAEYVKTFGSIPWTILETNPTPVAECKAEFVQGLYNSKTKIPSNVDMIVHSHCLEHFYEPREFFENTDKLALGTKMCFSVPSLWWHLSHCYTNVMNFEHTYFCYEGVIEYWLERFGFQMLEKKYYRTDHSIFYAAEKISNTVKDIEPPNDYTINKDLFIDWANYHTNLISNLNEVIKDTDRPVFLFGAHVNSQFLLAFGLDAKKIICLLDNNPRKHGLRLYGTDLKVNSPKILADYDDPLIILKSGVFNEEIKKDILENINSSAEFI